MAASREKESLARVLVHEGGYVNNPRDPGGPTNKGVTQRVYDAYRKGKNLTTRSVKGIETTELNDIYRKQYWDAVKGDQLPAGVDYVVFDGAVNSGPKQSIKWLQRALSPHYKGGIDGVMGISTFAAIDAVNDNDALVDRICDQRLAFLRSLRTWSTFGKGWASRVAEVRSIGKAWATPGKAKPPAASFMDGGQAKAPIESAAVAPSTAPADISTGAGVASGGVAGTLQTLQDQLTPFSSAGGWLTKAIIALTIASAVLVIGGLAYRWYVNRRTAKLAQALNTVPA